MVLEIGSGTGQHAVHFAAALPHLRWQCTDLPSELPGLQMWLDEAKLENVLHPLAMAVGERPWPFEAVDVVYTANTIHIMDLRETVRGLLRAQNFLYQVTSRGQQSGVGLSAVLTDGRQPAGTSAACRQTEQHKQPSRHHRPYPSGPYWQEPEPNHSARQRSGQQTRKESG